MALLKTITSFYLYSKNIFNLFDRIAKSQFISADQMIKNLENKLTEDLKDVMKQLKELPALEEYCEDITVNFHKI